MSVYALTVREPVQTCFYPGWTPRAPLAAFADEAVADSRQYTDAEAHRVVAESDRLDFDTVEHVRQSRLSRWQEQRTNLQIPHREG